MNFTKSHEWVRLEGKIATVGISHHAQKELGEIVYVELPPLHTHLQSGEEAVVVESTKAAYDIYSPVSGTIIEVNESLRECPEKINHSAEGEGWLYKMEVAKPQELNALLSAEQYKSYINPAS